MVGGKAVMERVVTSQTRLNTNNNEEVSAFSKF
jgi:hypothetical protein